MCLEGQGAIWLTLGRRKGVCTKAEAGCVWEGVALNLASWGWRGQEINSSGLQRNGRCAFALTGLVITVATLNQNTCYHSPRKTVGRLLRLGNHTSSSLLSQYYISTKGLLGREQSSKVSHLYIIQGLVHGIAFLWDLLCQEWGWGSLVVYLHSHTPESNLSPMLL